MHGNHHHHYHHQRTDLGGIMSITSVGLFTIGPFVPCTPLCKILNTPVMSPCLVIQNDGTWVEKHQRFLFNVYKRFYFCHVFYVFNVFLFFFSGTFFTSMYLTAPRLKAVGRIYLLAITSVDLDQFSRFFYRLIEKRSVQEA